MTAILDTSFLFALTDQGDRNHQRVLAIAQGLPENKIPNKKIEKCFFEKVIIFV